MCSNGAAIQVAHRGRIARISWCDGRTCRNRTPGAGWNGLRSLSAWFHVVSSVLPQPVISDDCFQRVPRQADGLRAMESGRLRERRPIRGRFRMDCVLSDQKVRW